MKSRDKTTMRILAICALSIAFAAPSETIAAPTAGEVVKLSGDHGFLEGPVWNEKEGALYLSDMKASAILKWTPEKGMETFEKRETAPNGLALDGDGGLIFCEPAGQRLAQRQADGEVVTQVDSVEGRPIAPPNDVWKGSGVTFFTIPDRSRKDPKFASNDFIQGAVIAVPDNGKPFVAIGKPDLKSPNGIVGSADGKHLYYTNAGKVWRADIAADFTLSHHQIVALSGWDGLAIDEMGNIYTTSKSGLAIYSPTAELIADIAISEATANFCFGGKDGKTLFIAARTGLYSIQMDVRGDGFATR